jgi:aspartate 1-decarboxylase
MMRRLVRAAIRNATVTRGEGLTLRIDPLVLTAANVLPLEEVEVVSHATGERFTTFAEAGGSGEVAFGRVRAGDVVSIVSWGVMHDGQTLAHHAKIVTLDARNQVVALEEVRST